MEKVCVLMSAYNGEKYIREQIDSILNQSNVEVSLIIRDDGSSDETINILEEYSKTDHRVQYYKGKNVGPAFSFLNLINCAPYFDYYALADQDDVWDIDKLYIATSMLSKEVNENIPLMYYSNLRIVDENLNYVRNSHDIPAIIENKYSALIDSMPTGCTMVFNRRTVELIKDNLPEKCTMHDTWIYLICMFLGKCCYDFEPHISYRQHSNNVIGTYLRKKTVKVWIDKIKRVFDRSLQPRYTNANSFFTCYKGVLNEKDKKMLLLICQYKDSFINRLKLLFCIKIHAFSISRDMAYRLLIILGIA